VTTLYCPYCGLEILDPDPKFCPRCGRVIVTRIPASDAERQSSPGPELGPSFYPTVSSTSIKSSERASEATALQNAPLKVPQRKSHTLRNVLIIVLIAGTLLTAGFFTDAYGTSSHTQTWQQWGMSISYPSGTTPILRGATPQQQANSSVGEVRWLWNDGDTWLGLSWGAASSYNYTLGFQAIRNYLAVNATNLAVTARGNVTMAGTTWEYQTYSFTYNGRPDYASYAITYYAGAQRGYDIGYGDIPLDNIAPNTLATLETYGNTFVG
jgi:hypothetical protein